MLEAGFTTLEYLKRRILPAGAVDSMDFDEAIARLGRGVAARFNAHCNRILPRSVDLVDEFNALARAIVLRAFPVESVDSVQIRTFTGALDTHEAGYQIDESAGLMLFETAPGDATERIVVTYTGGFWLDDGGDQPAGSTALPDDLTEAFIMQVHAWAVARNIFGTVAMGGMEAKAQNTPSPVTLLAEVEQILNPYRRFSNE